MTLLILIIYLIHMYDKMNIQKRDINIPNYNAIQKIFLLCRKKAL